MYFARLIVVTFVFMLGLLPTVLSSPAIAASLVNTVPNTPSQIKREESLNILVAKEYMTTTINWNITSATSTSISGSPSTTSSTAATSTGLEKLNRNSWLINAMVVGGLILSLF